MKEKLSYLTKIVHDYMHERNNFGRTVSIKIKSSDFQTISRSKSFASEVRQAKQLENIVHELLEQNRGEIHKVRLLGVAVSNLEREKEEGGIQLKLPFLEDLEEC